MIVSLAQSLAWMRANRLWLASLAAACALNAIFLGLASLAPMGRLPGLRPQEPLNPVEIVMRRRVPPPPPDLSGSSESPPSSLPPRFRPQTPSSPATPKAQVQLPPPRLNLGIARCDPDDREAMRRPDCAALQWTGTASEDWELDELAAARGWVKPKPEPRSRQSTMSETADASAPELRGQLFKDPPFSAQASGPQLGGP